MAWVIDDAPVPADLAWTLTVIARSCDKNGRGARQSAATIAEKTGKSPKQVQRDIVRLRKLGLLVLGDQRLVGHLPAGQRPTVYDLPLTVKGPKPIKASPNPTGLKKDGGTPPMDGTPPLQGTPPMDGGSTPPIHGVGTPPMDGVQKNLPEEPLEEPSFLPSPEPAAGPVGVNPDRTEEEIVSEPETQQPHPDAVTLADSLPAVGGKQPWPRLRHQIAAAIAVKLAAGWTTGALRTALTDALSGANGPGVYLWRLANQIDDAPPVSQRHHDPTGRGPVITGVVASHVTGGQWQPANFADMSTGMRRAARAYEIAAELDAAYGTGATAPPAPAVPPGQRTAEAMLAESRARAAAASAKTRTGKRPPGAGMAALDAALAELRQAS